MNVVSIEVVSNEWSQMSQLSAQQHNHKMNFCKDLNEIM